MQIKIKILSVFSLLVILSNNLLAEPILCITNKEVVGKGEDLIHGAVYYSVNCGSSVRKTEEKLTGFLGQPYLPPYNWSEVARQRLDTAMSAENKSYLTSISVPEDLRKKLARSMSPRTFRPLVVKWGQEEVHLALQEDLLVYAKDLNPSSEVCYLIRGKEIKIGIEKETSIWDVGLVCGSKQNSGSFNAHYTGLSDLDIAKLADQMKLSATNIKDVFVRD